MKKIICLALVFIFFGHAAYALDLDGMKEHFLRGEWKEAIREGESLLGLAKRDSENLDQLYYYLALSYMKDRNYLRVSDICEILLEEFPSSKFVPQAHYVLIDAYASNNNFTAAQASAASFLQKYPGNEHAREVEVLSAKFGSMAGDSRISPAAASTPGNDASDMDIVLASDPAGNAGPEVFWVQVGAFSNVRNADNLASKLSAASYATTVSPSEAKGKSIYKVRVGPYYARADALGVSKKLSRQGYPTKVIP